MDFLPPIGYNSTDFVVPRHFPSEHLLFDSSDITKLGLKSGSTWNEQNHEFDRILSSHDDAKRVLWVRHAQGIHNAAEMRLGTEEWHREECTLPLYFDAPLNDVGIDQCKVLQAALTPVLLDKSQLSVDLIVVSPLQRAIHTAEISFKSVWDSVPVVAVELARERFGKNICDKRRTVSELKVLFPSVNFDLFMVGEEDSFHTETVRESPREVRKRVERFMHWLTELPPQIKTVAVVGHSDYMSHASEAAGFPHHWPSNCELVPMMIAKKKSE